MTKKETKNKIGDFFTSEKNRILHFARKEMKSWSEKEPEDLISDVFLNILEKAEEGLSIENIGAYFYRSLKNRIIDAFRSRKNTLSLDEKPGESEESFVDFLEDIKFETHSEVEKKKIKERVFSAVENLSEDFKAVWTATEIDGKTFNELSEESGEPIGTLLSRKHRANSFLRKELADIKEFIKI